MTVRGVVFVLVLVLVYTSGFRIQKNLRKKIKSNNKAGTKIPCELPIPYEAGLGGECAASCSVTGGTDGERCAFGEICCPPSEVPNWLSPGPAVLPPAPAADPVVTDDPAAHTAIWFHGLGECSRLKARAQYPGRSDVKTPISPTDEGGVDGNVSPGSSCHNWGVNEDPWQMPIPVTAQLTVSGYSLGRHGFYNFLRLHGSSVQRAVLFDPSFDNGEYPKEGGGTEWGMEIVKRWLREDSSRVFVYAYGGSTIGFGITPWKKYFIDQDTNDIRQQVFVVHNTNFLHYQVPIKYRTCLFDNTCGGLASHDYDSTNYKK
jgi:hypothetical protein